MTPPRYELKYWASDQQAADLEGRLEGLCTRDPQAASRSGTYTVTSLYYDTEDFEFFLEKIEGLKRRVKVRLRRYGDGPSGFVELKCKHGRRIRKQRVPLTAAALESVAHGDGEPLRERAETDEAARLVLNRFAQAPLRPVVVVRYSRTAYLFRDDPGVRLTFDRALCAEGQDLLATFLDPAVTHAPMTPVPTRASAILEVKVTGPIPRPIAEALRASGVVCRAISKYCLAVALTQRLPAPFERFQASYLAATLQPGASLR